MCGGKKAKNVCIAQHAISMVVNIHRVTTLNNRRRKLYYQQSQESKEIKHNITAETATSVFLCAELFVWCSLANHLFSCPVGGGIMF